MWLRHTQLRCVLMISVQRDDTAGRYNTTRFQVVDIVRDCTCSFRDWDAIERVNHWHLPLDWYDIILGDLVKRWRNKFLPVNIFKKIPSAPFHGGTLSYAPKRTFSHCICWKVFQGTRHTEGANLQSWRSGSRVSACAQKRPHPYFYLRPAQFLRASSSSFFWSGDNFLRERKLLFLPSSS